VLCQTSELLCENNMEVLKLLRCGTQAAVCYLLLADPAVDSICWYFFHCSEEVFDYSKNQITSARAQTLKDSLKGDFDTVFKASEVCLCAF
jgi:hypothetical protein